MNLSISDSEEKKGSGLRPVTPLGILAEKLQSLVRRSENRLALNSDFVRELRLACELASGLEAYVVQCTSGESTALKSLASKTALENWDSLFTNGTTDLPLEGEMLSGHVEGQFLQLLVAATRAKRVLEIGMFTGYSALAMAEALPSDGLLVACEVDDYTASFACKCFEEAGYRDKIQVEVGPAAETLDKLAQRGDQFDFVFLDADKPGYQEYYRQLLSGSLLAPHALICIDNTLMQGQPYSSGGSSPNGEAIAAFNRELARNPRVQQVLVPLRDGVTLVRRVDEAEGGMG